MGDTRFPWVCLYSITGKVIYRRGDADVIPTDGSEPSVTHLAHTHLVQATFITLCRFEEVFQLLEFIHESACWCIAESQIYPSSPQVRPVLRPAWRPRLEFLNFSADSKSVI